MAEDKSCTSYMNQNTIFILIIIACLVRETINNNVVYWMKLMMEFMFTNAPRITLDLKKQTKTQERCEKEMKCVNPSTLETLGYAKVMNKDHVNKISKKAVEAQTEWCKTSFAERRKVLRSIQQYVIDNCEDICENGEAWLDKQYRWTGPMMMHKSAYVQYVPFGVLGVIAPWNYPFHNMLNHVISGIFSGNALVCKVSEQTSWSSLLFSQIVHQALRINGHNPDLVQVITGYAEAGEALVSCPWITSGRSICHGRCVKIFKTCHSRIRRQRCHGCV